MPWIPAVRRIVARRLVLAGFACGSLGLLNLGAGCPEDEEAALRAFRDTAYEGLRSGLTSISAGVIDGLFDALLFGVGDNTNDNSDTGNDNDNAG